VFRYGSDTFDLASVIYVEGLDAAIVQDAPYLDHSFRVSGNETIKVRQAVYANQTVLVTIQCHNWGIKVRVPYEDIQVETTTHNDFMLF